MTAPRITVIRHPKERIAKCSLRFLHDRPEIEFATANAGFRFDATGFLLLEVGAPTLSPADAEQPLLILDSTWRYLPRLVSCLDGEPIRRGLPAGIVTAYPRVSAVYEDPVGGLASVEALYVAMRLLGEDDPSLLDGYHWKAEFLAQF